MTATGAREKSAWLQLFWVICFFIIIVLGIWQGCDIHNCSLFYILILGGMVGLNGFYGECSRKLGFWPKNFKSCFLEYGKKLLVSACLIFFLGLLFGTIRYTDLLRALLNLGYGIGWGLFQQYILNGFFVNRLAGFFEDEDSSQILWGAATLFALVHTPNWFLMVVTFFGGWVCAKVYLKHRNLYFLGLAHAMIGFLLYFFIPDSVSHHFVIGPKYLRS